MSYKSTLLHTVQGFFYSESVARILFCSIEVVIRSVVNQRQLAYCLETKCEKSIHDSHFVTSNFFPVLKNKCKHRLVIIPHNVLKPQSILRLAYQHCSIPYEVLYFTQN